MLGVAQSSFNFPLQTKHVSIYMHILIVHKGLLPAHTYGGSERVAWWLGKALGNLGHQVTFLAGKGSTCPFAKVLEYRSRLSLASQIPQDIDIVHLHHCQEETLPIPTLTTFHGNSNATQIFDRNSVFLSYSHAKRHGAQVYVYNGIDLDAYGTPAVDNRRLYFHFLGHASWRVKNVRGAIDLANRAGVRLHVIGGRRVNLSMGLRITLSPHVRFHGMVSDDGKKALLQNSRGLIYPVLWHEPFGLSIIESLYFGCPVFGTPYGSLPELLGQDPRSHAHRKWQGEVEAFHSEFGFLSSNKAELVDAIREANSFNRQKCQDYVAANFSAERMARDYTSLYEKILDGQYLHQDPPVFQEKSYPEPAKELGG